MMFLVHVFKETVHPKMKCKRITYPHQNENAPGDFIMTSSWLICLLHHNGNSDEMLRLLEGMKSSRTF